MVDNEYESMLGGTDAAPENEYETMINDDRAAQRNQVATSMYAASKVEPDRAAKVISLSRSLDLPTDLVDRNYEQLAKKQELESTDYDQMIEQTPSLAKWMENKDNAAAGRDDIAGLSQTEKTIREVGTLRQMYNGLRYGLAKGNATISKSPAFLFEFGVNNIANPITGGAFKDDNGQGQRAPDEWWNNSWVQHYEKQAEELRKQTPDLEQSITAELSKGDYSRAGQVLAVQMSSNAPQMALLIIGAMTGMEIPALAYAGVSTAAEKSDEIRKEQPGLDPFSRGGVAMAHGSIEVGMESVGTFGFLKGWSNKIAERSGPLVAREVIKDMSKTLLYSVASEGNEEAITSLAQDFTDYATGINPNALDGIGQRALDAGILGGTMGAGMTGPAAYGMGMARAQEVRRANAAKALVEDLIKQKQESKLNARSPELHSEFIRDAVSNTEFKEVQIPIQAFDTYFQAKGINPLTVANELGKLPEYGAAKEAGTNLEMPLETFVQKVVEQGHTELVNDIKFDAEDKTINEIAAEKAQLEKDTKAAAEAAEANAEPAGPQESAAAVGEVVAEQLEGVGADPEQAILYAKTFNSLGQRLGIDPQELFNQFKLKISDGEAPAPAEGQTLNQGQVTPRLAPAQLEAALKETFESPDALERYNALPSTEGGVFVDTDTARELYGPYTQDRMGAMLNAEDTDSYAGGLAARAWQNKLAQAPSEPGAYAQILAGGSASGKTRYRTKYKETIKDADVVFDTTSANYDRTKERLEQGLASGRNVLMTYIYRDFDQAVAGNAARFKETGRFVTPDYMAYSHAESLNTFMRLAQEYAGDPRVTFEVFNNSGETIERLNVDQLAKLRYNDANEGTQDEQNPSAPSQDGQDSGAGTGSGETAVGRLTRRAEAGLRAEVDEIFRAKSAAGFFGPVTLFQSAVPTPGISPLGFFSQVETELLKMDFKSIPAADLANRIKNLQGIKKDELEALGLLDWLATQDRVAKDDVLAFVRGNGIKVEQVVLGEDFEGAGDRAEDVDWTDAERDHSNDSDDIYNETEYYLNDAGDDYWQDERDTYFAENTEEYTDEDGEVDMSALEQAWESERRDRAEQRATEAVESDDWSSARYTVRERNTGLYLYGSDELGWYDSEGREYSGNLDEAKIQAVAKMIEDGTLEGNTADLVKPADIKWRSATAAVRPAQGTITKRANKIIAENSPAFQTRLKEWAGEEAPTDQDKKSVGRQMAEETYDDPNDPKNKVQVRIDNEIVDGYLEGNNARGWKLTVYEKKSRRVQEEVKFTAELQSKDLEAAKEETIQHLLEKKVITPAGAPGGDPNEVSGKSKFARYSVEGRHNYREVLLTLPRDGEKFFYRNHFDQANILAHVRISDRVDAKGRKTLFIEEIQSDWHQQGRESGYKDPKDRAQWDVLRKERADLEEKNDQLDGQLKEINKQYMDRARANAGEGAVGEAVNENYRALVEGNEYDAATKDIRAEMAANEARRSELTDQMMAINDKMDGAVPDAPFKNTDAWAALALKRMLRLAVEQNYEAIAWSPAQVHVDRWGTDSVSWHKVEQPGWEVVMKNGEVRPAGQPLDTREKVEEILNSWGDEYTEIRKASPYFLVGSVEQRGGVADGTNIEELARRRGELLERKGERVKTKEELQDVIATTLGRERNDRSLGSLTNQIWERMQKEPSGAKLPRAEGMKAFYDKMVPDVMQKLVRKIDKDAKIEVGKINAGESTAEVIEDYSSTPEFAAQSMDVLEVPLTDKIKEIVGIQGFSLFQNQGDVPRGLINIGDSGINIQLLKDADRSTFFHETGHFYVEVLKTVAARADAPAQVKQDFQTMMAFVENDGGEISVEQHEKLARAFEAYLMEGKAPSSDLRKAFVRFKTWLVDVYKSITALNVQLNDDIRAVFDRLLATDQEIEAAQALQNQRPLFVDPAKYGLTDEQLARYQSALDAATLAANDDLRAQVMEDIKQEETALYEEQEVQVREQAEIQANNMPVYKALDVLQRRKPVEGINGGQKLKLDRKAVLEMVGEEKFKALPRPAVYSNDGMHPDVLAPIFGFESGRQMLDQILASPSKKEFIDRKVEFEMNQLHPKMFQSTYQPEAAMKAIHNDHRAQVIQLEMEFLREQNPGVVKDITQRAAKRPPSNREVKEIAQKIIGQRNVEDIKPQTYLVAERQAAAEAGKLLAAGDVLGVLEAKRKELLNHSLYRAALEAKDDTKRKLKFFKRLNVADKDLGKTRDTNLVNTARAVLAAFGIGKDQTPPAQYLENMKKYDPEAYQSAAFHVQAATQNGVGNYAQIKYDDFVAMSDAVKALWDLSRSSKEIEIDGRRVSVEQVRGELIAQMQNIVGERRTDYTRSATKWEQVKSRLLSARADMTRIETWAQAMDVEGVGVFTRAIFKPISDAVVRYRMEKMGVMKDLEKLFRDSKAIFTNDKIVSDELRHEFKNKSELLMAILHTGNGSNLRKLLVGRGWGEMVSDETLDTSRWDRFIARMQATGVLTKADYDFVQSVWDLNESLKPGAQKAHKQMLGFYFNEITAEEIKTPFGNYRGGYIPAKLDLNESEDAQIRKEREEFEGNNNSYQFPTTGRGFTKSRVEQYAGPLSLDMNLLANHIDAVLRFTHIEPRVKEVGRLVTDKDFRQALKEIDPTIAKDALIPWLQRAATQKVVLPSAGGLGRATDAMARYLRTAASAQVMVGNLTNALQQLTGFSVSATKVDPTQLASAMTTYIGDVKGTTEMIMEMSPWMKTNQGSTLMDSADQINEILLNPNTFDNIKNFTRRHGQFLQSSFQNVVNTVTWLGAYNEAIAAKATHEDAVFAADSAVRTTQGTQNPEDISRWETGTHTERLFKQFVGYFNMLANLNGSELQKISRDVGLKNGAGRAFYVYTTALMIPAVLSELIVQAMAGNIGPEDDDDSYLKWSLGTFFGSQIKTVFASLPYGGAFLTAGWNNFNEKRYDDRLSLSPAVSLLEGVAGVPATIYKRVADKVDNERKITRDSLMLIGLLTGLPTAPFAKPINYSRDVAKGKIKSSGPIDYTRGLITGKGPRQ